MSSLTNYGERLALDITTNAVGGSTPAGTRLVALYTVAPDETGGGTEVTGGGYVRQSITFGVSTTDGSGATTSSNTNTVLFPAATASWGTIVAIAVFDNAVTPNMIWYGNLATSKVVGASDQFRLPIGSVVLGMA